MTKHIHIHLGATDSSEQQALEKLRREIEILRRETKNFKGVDAHELVEALRSRTGLRKDLCTEAVDRFA